MSKPKISSELHWQAVDPARNVARDYRLYVTRDLFGWTIVERRWGRIGARGQYIVHSYPNEQSAELIIAAIRKRRERSAKRIGVAYRPVEPVS